MYQRSVAARSKPEIEPEIDDNQSFEPDPNEMRELRRRRGWRGRRRSRRFGGGSCVDEDGE
ncbi:hypothetical protein U1Q18_034797, partial [Sarracenia purpurea var. burkii]